MASEILLLKSSMPLLEYNTKNGDIRTTELIPKDAMSDISLEDAKELRDRLSNKIVYMHKQKSLRMEVYI